MSSVSTTWGTTAAERQLKFPCDEVIVRPSVSLFRGITINASASTLFKWLCQMRVAPYSYDWIDNAGRQSPPRLTPGLDQLAVGQDVMTIFDLISFQQDRHLTLRTKSHPPETPTIGDIAVSYLINEKSTGECRLLVKLVSRHPPGIRGSLMKAVLPWGDLIMMRRQLLNFKRLAERKTY